MVDCLSGSLQKKGFIFKKYSSILKVAKEGSSFLPFVYLTSSHRTSGGAASLLEKKMAERSAGKRGDSPLHLAARSGNLELVMEIISNTSEEAELKEILSKQNHSSETPLYVASEYGYADLVEAMIKHCDIDLAGSRARNGCDAFHVAAKQGNLGKLAHICI